MTPRVNLFLLSFAAATLVSCGQGGEAPPPGPVDTSFEEASTNPVPGGNAEAGPAPVNTSIAGGSGEQAAAGRGDASPREGSTAEVRD
ncbi:hypothetical protein [Porphyrobacter sp. GA68]|uniref:hypothetical protein n=1 Tax=Porphyrobacter sp. GA68 TaxID=2883480 RepID=UPI001D182204|nr:hypothetical protein [Porphyrobacter sp. GA68]